MAKKTTEPAGFTAETTPIAPAATLLQRDPAPTIRYGFFRRLADSWAGFRDRRRVGRGAEQGKPAAEFRTDWIVGLEHACRTHQEIERRATGRSPRPRARRSTRRRRVPASSSRRRSSARPVAIASGTAG